MLTWRRWRPAATATLALTWQRWCAKRQCMPFRLPPPLRSDQASGAAWTDGPAALCVTTVALICMTPAAPRAADGVPAAAAAAQPPAAEPGVLRGEDFAAALQRVGPSIVRGAAVDVAPVAWEEVGGYAHVKQRLQQAVEWPLRHAGGQLLSAAQRTGSLRGARMPRVLLVRERLLTMQMRCWVVCRRVPPAGPVAAARCAAARPARLQQDTAGARCCNRQQGNLYPTVVRAGQRRRQQAHALLSGQHMHAAAALSGHQSTL